MPPIRVRKISKLQAAHWLLGRLGGVKHTLESIQGSKCSEAMNGVFTNTEYRLLQELLNQVANRVRLEITGD